MTKYEIIDALIKKRANKNGGNLYFDNELIKCWGEYCINNIYLNMVEWYRNVELAQYTEQELMAYLENK